MDCGDRRLITRTFVYLPLKMLHLLVTGVAVYLQLALTLSMYEGRRVNHLASSPTVLAQPLSRVARDSVDFMRE